MLIAEESHQHYPQNYADKAGPRSSLARPATGTTFIPHQMEARRASGSGRAATGPTRPLVRVSGTEHLRGSTPTWIAWSARRRWPRLVEVNTLTTSGPRKTGRRRRRLAVRRRIALYKRMLLGVALDAKLIMNLPHTSSIWRTTLRKEDKISRPTWTRCTG